VIGTYNQACYGVVDGNVFDGGYNLRYTSGVEVWSIPPGSETFSFSNNLISAGSGNSQRTGARFAINTPCACTTPATQFIFAHNVVYARSVGFVGNDSTWLMNNSLNYSGRVVNNVFFGNFGQRMLSLNGGSLEAYQNNLVITDPNVGSPKMALYNNNGTPIFDMATLETKICDGTLYGTAYWRATGNQAVSVTPATLFVNPPTASDVALDDLLARDLHIKSGQAATLAFGLDTGSSVCGGVTGSAAACTGSGTNSCGNITKDRDGVTRPAVPAVGAYEP